MATDSAVVPYLTHITADGERWDTLSNRYYGDPYGFLPIIFANPSVFIDPILPAGLAIKIPVIDAPPVLASDLPPWKQ